jgi:hypothetical protein
MQGSVTTVKLVVLRRQEMIVRDFQLFRSTRNLENITPRRGIRQWPCADVGTYGGDPNDLLAPAD